MGPIYTHTNIPIPKPRISGLVQHKEAFGLWKSDEEEVREAHKGYLSTNKTKDNFCGKRKG